MFDFIAPVEHKVGDEDYLAVDVEVVTGGSGGSSVVGADDLIELFCHSTEVGSQTLSTNKTSEPNHIYENHYIFNQRNL